MTWKIVGASEASVLYIYIYIYIDKIESVIFILSRLFNKYYLINIQI